jgi:molybdate transport system substrate-binding protein
MQIPTALAALTVVALSSVPSFSAEPIEVTVYAAASLRDVLVRLAPACEKRSGARFTLIFNFGASGDLAMQIEAAGRADLFFSADEDRLDRLERKGLIEAGTRRSILSNRLVVIGPAQGGAAAIRSAADLAGPAVRRIAIANPETVPAGKYARAWLERAGLWPAIEGRIVPALDVRAALAAVESGLVEAGVVYATDAAASRRARILFEVPAADAPRISYGVAALGGRPGAPILRAALECLTGSEAMAEFQRAGFILPLAGAVNQK